MKKTDIPAVIVNGNGNNVEVNVTYGETSLANKVAFALAFGVFAGATILAVSLSCPELLVDFVRSIIDIAIGG